MLHLAPTQFFWFFLLTHHRHHGRRVAVRPAGRPHQADAADPLRLSRSWLAVSLLNLALNLLFAAARVVGAAADRGLLVRLGDDGAGGDAAWCSTWCPSGAAWRRRCRPASAAWPTGSSPACIAPLVMHSTVALAAASLGMMSIGIVAWLWVKPRLRPAPPLRRGTGLSPRRAGSPRRRSAPQSLHARARSLASIVFFGVHSVSIVAPEWRDAPGRARGERAVEGPLFGGCRHRAGPDRRRLRHRPRAVSGRSLHAALPGLRHLALLAHAAGVPAPLRHVPAGAHPAPSSIRRCWRSSSGRPRTCSPTARSPTCCCSAASSPGRSSTGSR